MSGNSTPCTAWLIRITSLAGTMRLRIWRFRPLSAGSSGGDQRTSKRFAYFDYAFFCRALAQVKSANPDLAKPADIVDDMERLLPDLDTELLTILPLESEQQAQDIVRSVISRGDVSDFMYVVAARCLTSPKNPPRQHAQ
jgi:hypothetical protein